MHRFLPEIARGQPHFGRFVCWPKHRMKRVVPTYSYNKLATYPLVPDLLTFRDIFKLDDDAYLIFVYEWISSKILFFRTTRVKKKFRKKKTKYRIMKEYERSNGEGDLFSWIFLTRIIYETANCECPNIWIIHFFLGSMNS